MNATLRNLQLKQRGFLWCTPSCVCELCLHADGWYACLLDSAPALAFYDTENPAPAEFRGVRLQEARA